jgi:ABC-type nitrate/sulfonate/bicarbonate transport system substrate-binding protein
MNKKAWIGISAGLLAILLVVLWLVLRPTPPNTTRPVHIGILKHESSLPIYIAVELGYFKKHDILVELVELPPGDHMPALLADRVDILSPTSFPTLFGVMAQHPDLLYVIFPGAEVSEGQTLYGLIVKSAFAGKSLKDIHGGIIMAINPFTKVNIQTILNSAGIPKESWPKVQVASREVALQAVADGTATAAIMDQPALAIALSSPGYRLLEANPRAKYIGSPYWSGAGAVKRATWNGHKDELMKLMAAVDDAVKAIRSDPLKTHQVLAARLGIPKETAAQMGGYYFPFSDESVPKDGIKSTVEALRSAGLLNSGLDLTAFFPPGLYGEK